MPLLVAARAIGTLLVRFESRRGLAPEHVEILELVAAQLAPGLEAAMLRAEAQRREARLASAMDHLTVGLVLLDASGLVVALNAEGRRLSGAGADRTRALTEQADGYQIRSLQTGHVLTP